ncbi:MAG: hypothetical protein QOG23_1518 [Blastocatellia bacterium]|jgi:hypothetical protein|nr:hypothetical protein [Blastocatellia bacterium]
MPRYDVKVSIDEQIVPPDRIACHHQEDPFPGGLTFRLTVVGERTTQFFPSISPGHYEHPDFLMSQSIFWSIESLLSKYNVKEADESSTADFFLNSIHTFMLSDSKAELTGVGSRALISS